MVTGVGAATAVFFAASFTLIGLFLLIFTALVSSFGGTGYGARRWHGDENLYEVVKGYKTNAENGGGWGWGQTKAAKEEGLGAAGPRATGARVTDPGALREGMGKIAPNFAKSE